MLLASSTFRRAPSATALRRSLHPRQLVHFSSITSDDDKGDSDTTAPPDEVPPANDTNSPPESSDQPESPPDAIFSTKSLRPTEVVTELNRHIVGQSSAKKAVAIAMRNRWRRRQLPPELLKEVTPRNVLMIGPTGCGKTEVARRMATLSDAPFLKVEATKFTEVGYHGRDVDQIVRDLMDVSMALTKKRQMERLRGEARGMVEERLLDILIGPDGSSSGGGASAASNKSQRDSFRGMLKDGLLENQEIEVDVPENIGQGGGKDDGAVMAFGVDSQGVNMQAIQDMMRKLGGGGQRRGPPTERKKMTVADAREVILEIELEKVSMYCFLSQH
jgi:ATP-dependent HslUV protease ATP-binding subunit HslU